MEKHVITEEQFRQIVNETVQNILMQEGFWDNIKGAFKPMGQVGKAAGQAAVNKMGDAAKSYGRTIRNTANRLGQGVQNAANRVGQGMQNAANRVGQGVQNAANRVGQVAQSAGQTMKAGYQDAKLQGYKQDAIKALDTYLQYAKQIVGTGDNTVQAVQNAIQALNRNANASKGRVGAFRNQFQRNLGMQQ